MEDKSWIGLTSHCCAQYLRGLKSFIEIARAHMEARSKITIYCPYPDCGNDKKYSDFEVVYVHLIVHGFVPNYTCWNKHREEGPNKRGEWVTDHQEGPNRREDGDQEKAMVSSVSSAFWSAMMTSLMRWLTMLKT